MNRRWLSAGLGITVSSVVCGAAVAPAADPPPGSASQLNPAAAVAPPEPARTIGDLSLGHHVAGEQLTPESLQHRVVLLAFWNRDDPACVACLPLLEQTHRALAPAGLLVVASHTGRGTPSDVKQTVQKLGFPCTVVDDAVVKGLDPAPLPHAVLFDHSGTCVARGSPAEIAARAGPTVRDAPPPVLAGRRLDKLAALERMLRDESKFGAVLRKAAESAASADGPTAEEAGFVVERLTAHAERLLAQAERLKSYDAPAAAGLLHHVVAIYRGTDLGKQGLERQREWGRDRQYAAGLQAAQLAAQLETMRSQALAPPGAGPGGYPAARPTGRGVASMAAASRIPPQVKAQMAQLAGTVRQLGPGSRYAARAEEIAIELSLDLPAAP